MHGRLFGGLDGSPCPFGAGRGTLVPLLVGDTESGMLEPSPFPHEARYWRFGFRTFRRGLAGDSLLLDLIVSRFLYFQHRAVHLSVSRDSFGVLDGETMKPLLCPNGIAAYLTALRSFCAGAHPDRIRWWRTPDVWAYRAMRPYRMEAPDPVATELGVLSRLWRPRAHADLSSFLAEALDALGPISGRTRGRRFFTVELPVWTMMRHGPVYCGVSAAITEADGGYRIEMEDMRVEVDERK